MLYGKVLFDGAAKEVKKLPITAAAAFKAAWAKSRNILINRRKGQV